MDNVQNCDSYINIPSSHLPFKFSGIKYWRTLTDGSVALLYSSTSQVFVFFVHISPQSRTLIFPGRLHLLLWCNFVNVAPFLKCSISILCYYKIMKQRISKRLIIRVHLYSQYIKVHTYICMYSKILYF
jgi:hypothetical protein